MILALLLLLSATPARAQDSDTQLQLARTLVSERGWEDSDDDAAIYAVHQSSLRRLSWRLGRAITLLQTIRLMSPRVAGIKPPTHPRQVWTGSLRLDAQRPRGWPRRVRWNNYVGRWRQALQRAGQVLRGEVSSKCDGPVDYWGSPEDMDNPALGGWERVDCGRTHNVFWRVPRRRPWAQ